MSMNCDIKNSDVLTEQLWCFGILDVKNSSWF